MSAQSVLVFQSRRLVTGIEGHGWNQFFVTLKNFAGIGCGGGACDCIPTCDIRIATISAFSWDKVFTGIYLY